MSNPWIEEPETGRWYMTTQDEYGRTVRRYSEEIYPTSSSQSYQPAGQYTQRTPRSEIEENSYSITSPGPSGTRNQIYGSESSRESPGGVPGTYQASPQTLISSAVDGSNIRNINSMTSRLNSLNLSDLDRDAQYTAAAPETRPWAPGPSSPHNTITGPGHASSSHQFGWAPSVGFEQQNYPSQNTGRRHISGTAGDTELLDPKYRVRNNDYKKFFKEGRVFKTLWTDAASRQTNRDQTFISVVKYGEEVHSKIRRFVVVRQKDKSCICLPVTSYEGRGHKKTGIDLSEHSQIYTHKHPKPVRGISMKPLKINLSQEAGSLKDQSLINYGSPYTVECNVKVLNIGVLDSDSLKILRRDYNKVHYQPDDYFEDETMDNQPQRKDEDLAFVGTGFTPNSSSAPGSSAYTASSDYDRPSSGNIKVEPGYTSGSSYYSSNFPSTTNAESGRSDTLNSSSTYPAPANAEYSSRPTTPLGVPSSSTAPQFRREAANEEEKGGDEDINLPSREEIQASRSSRARRESVSKSSRSSGKDRERDHYRDQHRKRR